MSLTSIISRHRLLTVGAVGVVAAAAATGTALAAHGTGAAPTATTVAPAAAAPSPSPSVSHARGSHAAKASHLAVEEVVAVSGDQLTVVDAQGTRALLTVAPRARVTGANGKSESLSSLPAGEIIVVVTTHGRSASSGAGSAASSPAPGSTATAPAGASVPVVVAVRDTGFAAR